MYNSEKRHSASLMTYVVITNQIFSKRRPNRVSCMRLDGRQNTGYNHIMKTFFYKNYCRHQECWHCAYRDYIYNTQDYKRSKI